MMRRLHISWYITPYTVNFTAGVRLRIVVDEVEGLSAKVFAYLVLPLSSISQSQRAQFDHICSPVDLEEYPENAPTVNSQPAWFRLNYIDVTLRSMAELDRLLTDVQNDLAGLWLEPSPRLGRAMLLGNATSEDEQRQRTKNPQRKSRRLGHHSYAPRFANTRDESLDI